MAHRIASGRTMRIMRLVLVLSCLCVTALGTTIAQQTKSMTVQAPPRPYAYLLTWEEGGQQAQQGPLPVESLPLRVNLSALPQGAQKVKLVLSQTDGPRSAVVPAAPGQSVTLKPEDFSYLTRLTVRLSVPDAAASYTATVTLLQPPAPPGAKAVTIVGGKGEAVFDLVPMKTATLRVQGEGLAPDEAEVRLVSAEGQPVTEIARQLKPVAGGAPAATRATSQVDIVVAAVPLSGFAGMVFVLSLFASLLAAVVALVERPGPPVAAGLTNWLLWLPPLLGLGLSGATATALAYRYRESAYALQALWPLAGVVALLLGATLAAQGRRIAAAACTAATAAAVTAPVAFSEPVATALAPLTILVPLCSIWALAAAGYVAVQAPTPAPAAAAVQQGAAPAEAAPGICPYCGQPRDPVTGRCACTVTPAVAPVSVAGPTLMGETGEVAGKQFALSGTVLIGRDPTCNIALGDKTVSRRHCTLEATAEGIRVRDEGSANGTFLNGQRVSEAVLHSGDTLQVGGARFRFLQP